MSFTLNLKVLKDWRSSLSVAFQILRRIQFIVEDTFSWGDFDPQIDWGGMAATGIEVGRCRYLKIWNFLWFSIDIRASLAAPFTTQVGITLPGTSTGGGDYSPKRVQGGAMIVYNAGVESIGSHDITDDTNVTYIKRPALAAYTAGLFIVIGTGFIEVKTNG